ncbi:MAG: ABC transporter permease subunit [Flavobacteriaceae bacterium]|nr:ABC transporter permease subunit [Flavobacteriaceae bacterium]
MKRLFLIEFEKLSANRSSRILIGAYLILLTSIALVAAIRFDIGPVKFHIAEQGIFNFPYIWHFNTFIGAWFKIFLAVVIVSMTANEYSNKTIKQNLIDGLSKREFLHSKWILILVFSGISTLFIFSVSLILGIIYSDYNEFSIIIKDLEFLFAYFIKLTAFFGFCLFLGTAIKRSAFALGFLGIWQALEGICYGMLKWKSPAWIDAETVFRFFPLNAMSNLIPEPFSRLSAVRTLANQIGENITGSNQVQWLDVCIVLVWCFIFYSLTYRLLKRRDL